MRITVAIVAALSFRICLAMADDEKPLELTAGAKAYFERADSARDAMRRQYETTILDLEIAIQGAASAQEKAEQRRNLERTKDRLAELKKSKVFAFLPTAPALGDIGSIAKCRVRAVIDDKTAVMALDGFERATLIVVTKTNTKALKAMEETNSPETWRVVAMESMEAKILRVVGIEKYVIVEPVKKGELEKLRTAYLALKQDANDPDKNTQPKVATTNEKPKPQNAPKRAMTNGPFTVWREPEVFKANEKFEIVVAIQLPEGTEKYPASDLSGKIVSSDGYRQILKFGQEIASVKEGVATLRVTVPGTDKKQKDTVTIESKQLDRTETFEFE